MHECRPPDCRALYTEQLPTPPVDVHRIFDPCAAAAEAERAQTAAPFSPVAYDEQLDADRRLVLPPAQSGGVQPNPLRPRGRRTRDSSSARATLRSHLTQTSGSASGRQQATVRQSDGTYRTNLPGHQRMLLAAISELRQDGRAASFAPANSLAAPATAEAVAATGPWWLAAPVPGSASWRHPQPMGDALNSATEAQLEPAPPSVSDSIHAAATEALAVARVPLTATELALCVRRDAGATSGKAEPVLQLLQVGVLQAHTHFCRSHSATICILLRSS